MTWKEKYRALKEKMKWLDPFTYVDLWVMPRVNPQGNKVIEWTVYIFFAVVFALALFLLFSLLFATRNPFVIVVSASMEPVMYRGDVLMLWGYAPEQVKAETLELDLNVERKLLSEFVEEVDWEAKKIKFKDGQTIPLTQEGDVIVYYSDLQNIQVIHRVIAKIITPGGTYFLTKGDNNPRIDQDCGKAFYSQLDNKKLFLKEKIWYPMLDLASKQSMQCCCSGELNAVWKKKAMHVCDAEGRCGLMLPVSTEKERNVDWEENCFACTEKECITMFPVDARKIDGKAVFRVPAVGCIKLWLFDDLLSLLLTGRLPANFKGIC